MRPRPDRIPEAMRAAGVTRRELEILDLVADHLRNREIAERLYLSERTVESHVSSLLSKLEVPNRQALVEVVVRLRDRPPAAGSLPSPLSSFVGRAREIEELLRLIADHRLVTLIGPAGAGKTRLAVQVARSAEALPPAVLVDLALVPPGSSVERLFADALGVAGEEARLRTGLRQMLAEGQHWMLVDNCEHVADPTATLVAHLLSSTAQLRVLATSHGPLGIAGEVVYQVQPLPLPPDTDEPSAVLEAASGQLFAERAATAAPGFAVTVDNARDVAAVCQQLDGLPLAIELAAARIRVFSPGELLSHLDERFDLLATRPQGAGSRHLSLEAALRWSYELLDEQERLLFERCSVFPGDFDYDTAVAILAYSPLGRTDLARLFPRLLDRSLISANRRALSTEYRMLDSVRQFARDQLSARRELERARAEHARHHLEHGAAALADLQGRDQLSALRWFDRHWADLRAAMRWTLDRQDAESAWLFIAGLGSGWDILGMRGELFDWLDVLLELPLPSGALGVEAGVTAALLLWYQDVERALALAERAWAQAQGEDDRLRALAQLAVGSAMRYSAGSGAIGKLEEAASEFRRLGEDWYYAQALEFLSSAVPDAATALEHLAHSADLFGELGDMVQRANCLNQMAHRSIDVNARLDAAEAWLTEARELAEMTGNYHEWLHAELFRARLEQRPGDEAPVRPRLLRLLPEFRRIGDQRCVSRCLLGLGLAALSDDHETARHHLTECVEIAHHAGERVSLSAGLRLLAELDHAAGRPCNAAVLLGAADATAANLDAERRQALPSDNDLRAALELELQSDALTSALAKGRDTPVGELLAAVHSQPAPASAPDR